MSDYECIECGWTPRPDAKYPMDRLIDHIEEEHRDGE